jgi:hypothetical protein
MQLGRKIMYTEIKQMIIKDEETRFDMPGKFYGSFAFSKREDPVLKLEFQ